MAKKKQYDLVLTRLLLIIKKLCNDERPTIQELADEFGVSVRTIQTDVYKRLSMIEFIQKDEFNRLKFIDGFDICKFSKGDKR